MNTLGVQKTNDHTKILKDTVHECWRKSKGRGSVLPLLERVDHDTEWNCTDEPPSCDIGLGFLVSNF